MTIIFALLAYLIMGTLAGVLGGLLGLGGGVITVPCLLATFHLLNFPEADVMHLAIGTSLAAMIFNTFSATLSQNKRKAVLWEIVRKMFPGFVLGSILGACLAITLSTSFLELIFAIFVCILGVYFFYKKPIQNISYKLPSTPILSLLATCIGAISNTLGIGGGTMTVPLLISFQIEEKKAIGTSAATTLILTIIGTLSYLILGWNQGSSEGNLGFINLPAFLIVGISSFLTAPIGVKLAHELPVTTTRKIFAIVLIVIGISIFFF